MKVIKRSGEPEDVSFDKVLNRLRKIQFGYGKDLIDVDIYDIAQKVCTRIYNNVSTTELDELAAQICSSLIIENPAYGDMASRIIVSNHHKNTSPSFSETIAILYSNKDIDGEHCPLVSKDLYETVMKNKEKLNSYIDYSRDYDFDYFGFKTLEKAYLMKVNNVVTERPQHMFMRVSLGIHGDDIKDALQTYDLMSKKYFIHATPTLFNAGTNRPQMSSCFLLSSDDSINGIYDTLQECANISKYAGGIGMHIHSIRAKGSKIRGTNGSSTGIIPMLRVFNNTARYVNQSGRRNGSIAVYLEPWHADIENFLELRKPHGSEEERTRDLFLALWISDLFMKRVKENGTWSLMCPDMCKGLSDVYGEEFERLYEKYEAEGKYNKQVPAQKIWFKILESQIESGQPYMLYKDACNIKSNQKNIGTIKSSNLCVAPETPILTSTGYQTINSLKDQDVEVWNGNEFSKTTIKQTGKMQKLITVKFSNGMEVRCTPYHKIYIQMEDTIKVIEAREAVLGMKLINNGLPFIENVHGEVKDKFNTLFEAIGKFINDNGKIHMKLTSPDKPSLCTLLLDLQTIGINSEVIKDGNMFSLVLDANNTSLMMKNNVPSTIGNEINITIAGIIDNNEYDDTYCFTEPKENKGMFNGVIMGNCTEIVEYTDDNETSVCNLASIALPSFVGVDGQFDYGKLHDVTKVITKNLNKVIDVNFYPVEKARRSNLNHRPIGIGVQGLADLFVMMRFPFESAEAAQLNKNIFETIYHAALESSMEIAKKRHEYAMEMKNIAIDSDRYNEIIRYLKSNPDNKYPGAYSSFEGSPASQGILQYDMWGVKPSDRYNWEELKESIQKYGLRNSLLLAPMPTASTSQILGFNECFEAFTSNIYKRKTLAGEFILVNKYLINDLIQLGIWDKNLKDQIIIADGSIQGIPNIPQELKELYKTVWEIKQKVVIDMAADRGAFICQSQSMNLFVEDPDFKKLSSMHFYAWSKGLKTGMYYLRSKPRAQAQKFTIDPTISKLANIKVGGSNNPTKTFVCTDEVCTMCSS